MAALNFRLSIKGVKIMAKQVKQKTLPQLIASQSPQAINAMVKRIEKAFKERESFEYSKNPNGSHIELRRAKNLILNNRRFAAFLIAVNACPDKLLNKSRKLDTRANLKGIKKIRMLCDYITGETRIFERVSLALFASTIIAALKGVQWISNSEQELILSNVPVQSLPSEVQAAIADYKHRYMSLAGDSRNQSCQFRTTFENLDCFYFSREDTLDSNRLGIGVNLNNPIITYLVDRWNLESVK